MSPRQQKLHGEREKLEKDLAVSDFSTLRTRVAFILNRYPVARNSDVTLQIKYWEHFEPEILKEFKPENLYRATRLTSVARARAKIQNEYGLFLASEPIRRGRRALEDATRDRLWADAPGVPTFSVYADESGKSSRWKIITAAWNADSQEVFNLQRKSYDWVKQHSGPREFHFSKAGPGSVDSYIAYWDWVLTEFTSLGFKALVVDSTTLHRSIQETYHAMYPMHIIRGLRHEWSTGRARQPDGGYITVIFDQEDELKDAILRNQLVEALRDEIRRQELVQVSLGTIQGEASYQQYMLQVADLFGGMVNRYYNETVDKDLVRPKDRLADHIRQTLDLTYDGMHLIARGDRAWIDCP